MNYKEAREEYKAIGIDTEKAISTLEKLPISIHCWQADDVTGFEKGAGKLTGGIQATGNYPGKARNAEELMTDFKKACSLIPGKKRLNLHASYLITDRKCDRDTIEEKDFAAWVCYAKENGLGLDFNPTFFSHPMVKDNLTLSSPDDAVRSFWIAHAKASRRISAYFAKELDTYSVCNLWIPDGYKDTPADRLSPRLRLKDSLDKIYDKKLDGVIDCLESKVFGIGLESFTVGSSEFYMGYAASHKDVYLLLDAGHYHPMEYISDKISALLCTFDKIPLHVTRPVRWDSDHVVRLDDEIKEIAKEIVRNNATEKVLIGLDYFDASINRIAAWVVGTRNMQKALLIALLEPSEKMKKLQDKSDFTALLTLSEGIKEMPWQAVWNEFLTRQGLDTGLGWYDEIMAYEKNILSKRNG